jgi:endonuclease/exonuclease/phosphatase (EEP) superfamily protein YafD
MIFTPSVTHHRSCRGSHCDTFLPERFGLLCWNVHKHNRHPDFAHYLEGLVTKRQIDCLLLQEARFGSESQCALESYAYDAAANLEVRGSFYGVLTAARCEAEEARPYLSKARESLLGTHKSLLASRYRFADGSPLLILNIHAINFRETGSYERELHRFAERVRHYEGPLIVAGDFNSWSTSRTWRLHRFKKALGLQTVRFDEKEKVTSFWGRRLDFIFYRGLELVDSAVFDDHSLSDHNPLYALFQSGHITRHSESTSSKF